MAFGFAQPLQRRLPTLGASPLSAPTRPPVDPAAGTQPVDVRAGLQKLGLLKPTEPGSNLPSAPQVGVTSPTMPSTPPLDDASGAVSSAAQNVANGMGSGAADALADAGAGIGDFLSALFGG